MNLKNYRIGHAQKNIVIQRQTKAGNWKDVSYHGSSVLSLAAGLIDLIGGNLTLEGQTLQDQIVIMRAEIAALKIELEKIIRERMDV